MTKNDLIKKAAREAGVSQATARDVIDATIGSIRSSVANGDAVRIPELGTFHPKTNPARDGINPTTREPIHIKASKGVHFKVSQAWKRDLND